jgi:predicted amidohydrolase YtcJ
MTRGATFPGAFGRVWITFAALAFAPVDRAPAQSPDRIYTNAKVWTAADARPLAQAFAVRGDRFVAVGSSAEIVALAGPATAVVDLGGRLVLPGFNDAHWHFPGSRGADLDGAENVAEIRKRLRSFARALPAGAWLVGRGWTPDDFPSNVAHRKYLDDLFPDRPVVLTDRDGHQALANSRALALAKITRASVDPVNGHIERDVEGEPTGLLKESAAGLVRRLVPPPSTDAVYASLRAEMTKAASFGLTSVQNASGGGLSGAESAALTRAIAEGTMLVRWRAAVPFVAKPSREQLARFVALRDTARGGVLTFGIAKGMVDGTVDAKTAAMLEPYVGGGNGAPMWTQADLNRTVASYDSAGIQVQLHAIGDKAIRMALDAFEFAAKQNGTSNRRHRVEHIEVPSLRDLPRFRQLGVIASTQAMFASPDQTTLENYAPLLGPERAARANSFKLFDDAGAIQAFGSDYPVFTMNVLLGIWTAVTRQTPDGMPEGGYYPAGRISVEAALRHFTRDAAYASLDETSKGTLTAGKYADFVVLSEDILTLPPAALLSAKVLLTVMGGRETWRAPGF